MADTLASGGRRVKVYVLSENGRWDDRGTGHVRCELDPQSKTYVLKVTAEDTGCISLRSQLRATHEAFYQIQEDDIISWTEDAFPSSAGVPTEVALSFAEAEGCRELWEKICHVDSLFKCASIVSAQKHIAPSPSNRAQRAINVSSPTNLLPAASSDSNAPTEPLAAAPDPAVPSAAAESLHLSNNSSAAVPLVDSSAPEVPHTRFFDEAMDNPTWNPDTIDDVIFPDTSNVLFLASSPGGFVPGSSSTDAVTAASFDMPDPDRSGVERLSRIMSDQTLLQIPAVRDRIIAAVSTGNYISKLCHVFRQSEQSTDIECLSMLYHVIRCLFIVGTNGVLRVLVNEKHLMDIVGCLEYDPEKVPELERKCLEAKEKKERNQKLISTQTDKLHSMTGTGVSCEHSPDMSCSEQQQKEHCLPDSVPSTSFSEPVQGSNVDRATVHIVHGVTDASSVQGPSDIHHQDSSPKEAKPAGEGPSNTEKNTDSGDGDVNMAHESCAAATESVRRSPSHKNGSEETTSSGNIGSDGEELSLVIRTHRDFLERKVAYKSVVPITDENVVSKIHQNYRVAYIRDVILSRVFDDGVSNSLSSVIVCNNVDIIMYFISSSTPLHELFDRLKTAVQHRRRKKEGYTRSHGSEKNGSTGEEKPKQFKDTGPLSSDRGFSDGTAAINDKDGMSPKKTDGVSPSLSKGCNSSTGATTSPSTSRVTRTTGESHLAASRDVGTSKVFSGKAGEERPLIDSVTVHPKSSEQNEEVLKDLCNMLGFLRELCGIVKGQQPLLQNGFHTLLLELGVLEVSVSLILDSDPQPRSLCCDILSAVIVRDQSDVRAHILKNATQKDYSTPRLQSGVAINISPGRSVKAEAVRKSHAEIESTAGNMVAEKEHPDACLERSTESKTKRSDIDTHSVNSGSKVEKSKCDSVRATSSSSGNSDRTKTDKNNDENERNSEVVENPAPLVMDSSPLEKSIDKQYGLDNIQSSEGKLFLPSPEDDISRIMLQKHVLHNVAMGSSSRIETEFPLLSAMVEVICDDEESGVALTVLELLKMLLDPLNMRNALDKDRFLNVFYPKFFNRLLEPIKAAANTDLTEQNVKKQGPDEIVSHLCDFLSFCVGNHAFKCKYFVLVFDAGRKVVDLVKHKKAHIRLSAVRFIRACVALSDDMYDRYIIRQKLLDPVMDMFDHNKNHDNLVGSAVLELVSFLGVSNREMLLQHVMNTYGSILEPSSQYCGVFTEAKRKWDDMKLMKSAQDVNREGGKVCVDQSDGMEGGGSDIMKSNKNNNAVTGNLNTGGKNEVTTGHTEDGDSVKQVEGGSCSNMKVVTGGNSRVVAGFFGQDPRVGSENHTEEPCFSRLVEDVTMNKVRYLIDGEHVGDGEKQMRRTWADGQEAGQKEGLSECAKGTSICGNGRCGDENDVKGGNVQPEVGWSKKVSAGRGRTEVREKSLSVAKGLSVTGLRSKAIAQEKRTNESKCVELKRVRSESGGISRRTEKLKEDEAETFSRSADGDVVMVDVTDLESDGLPGRGSKSGGDKDKKEGNNWSGCGRKVMRLSLSKGEAKSGKLDGKLGNKMEDGVWVAESSDEKHSPRKRERSCGSRGSEGGIEICTKTKSRCDESGGESVNDTNLDANGFEERKSDDVNCVSGQNEGKGSSPPKRRRTETGCYVDDVEGIERVGEKSCEVDGRQKVESTKGIQNSSLEGGKG